MRTSRFLFVSGRRHAGGVHPSRRGTTPRPPRVPAPKQEATVVRHVKRTSSARDLFAPRQAVTAGQHQEPDEEQKAQMSIS